MWLTQVTAMLDVHQTTISQWRHHGWGMNGDAALRLAVLLDIDIRDYATQLRSPRTSGARLERAEPALHPARAR